MKNKVILKQHHLVLMRLSPGESEAVMASDVTFVDMEYGWLLNHEF